MTATAAKSGYGTGHAIHVDSYTAYSGYIHAYRGYRTAKPPTGRRPKTVPEPSLPDDEVRRIGHFRAAKRLQAGDSVVVLRTIVRGTAFQVIGASAEGLNKAEPPLPRRTVSAPPSKRISSARAFAMQLEHLTYLDEVSSGDDPLISRDTAKLAVEAWRLIWHASKGRMPIPAACTGPDGQMLYAWDQGRHHLELEMIPRQPAEFFYKDRETRELWGKDYMIGDPLPAEAVEKFNFFI